jgi:Pyrimidine dimer DNA glycosylase
MRLWTLHPKYLDARGLVALWREALLAQKVLRGATRGYRHHPQLLRFSETKNPTAALAAYLKAVHRESVQRGYNFDGSKIGARHDRGKILETRGQLLYEWSHLKRKLKQRDPKRHREFAAVKNPKPHPLFKIIPGKVRAWEKVK